MRYRKILSAFYSQPLAILPAKLEEIRAFLHTKAEGDEIPEEEVERLANNRSLREESLLFAVQAALPEAATARRSDGVVIAGRVAILPVFGVISQRVGMFERMSGGVSTEEIGATLEGLVNDRAVKAIVMAFDSPGGSVAGVPELAVKIREWAGKKKIVGIADSFAASAAYYLLAQTSEVNVVPSGMVGSIGVITAHEDWSKAEEQEGVKTTLITSSKYKAEGNFFEPLSEEARAELQRVVDHYHAMFVKDVAKGRAVSVATVESEFGQGRMAVASEAVSRGMADRVATLEQVLRRLGVDSDSGGRRAEAEGQGDGDAADPIERPEPTADGATDGILETGFGAPTDQAVAAVRARIHDVNERARDVTSACR